jgi:hypothetical protein
MSNGNRPLSPREERYCQSRALGNSGVASCIAAGYSDNKKTASVTAARLNSREHVKARIAELIDAEAIVDLRSEHVNRLIGLRNQASAKGHTGSAIRAEELIGKAQNLYTESLNIVHAPLDDASSLEIRLALQAAVEKFGLPAPPAPPAADDDEPQPAAGEAVH